MARASEVESEARLLEAYRAADPEAAAEFIRRHQTALVRTVLRVVRRRAVAEEIVQETFLRAFEQLERIDPREGARPWLYRVAFNLARDHLRRSQWVQGAEQIDEQAELLHCSNPVDPERRVVALEERARLEEALSRLPPKLREVAVLRYVENLPFALIAQILGVSSAALRVRALRARAQLIAAFGPEAPQ